MQQQMRRGLVHVYTGNGKGKTTASLGLALRAAGHGLSTVIVQFIKSRECGEHRALARLSPLIQVLVAGNGFVMDEPSRADLGCAAGHRILSAPASHTRRPTKAWPASAPSVEGPEADPSCLAGYAQNPIA